MSLDSAVSSNTNLGIGAASRCIARIMREVFSAAPPQHISISSTFLSPKLLHPSEGRRKTLKGVLFSFLY